MRRGGLPTAQIAANTTVGYDLYDPQTGVTEQVEAKLKHIDRRCARCLRHWAPACLPTPRLRWPGQTPVRFG